MTYSKASGFIQRREDLGLEVVDGLTPHEPVKEAAVTPTDDAPTGGGRNKKKKV